MACYLYENISHSLRQKQTVTHSKIQTYDGNAIRKNTSRVIDTKQAIWDIYHHTFSSDDDPNHGECPRGESRWFKYQQSLIKSQ